MQYIKANMVNHVYSRKSILGYLMTFTRWAVLWQSRLQKYVTSFTAEVKYIAFNKEKMSCYVWQSSYMILFTRKRILSRTMIVLLQSILVRILLLNLYQNTFRLYINGLKMLWRWNFFFFENNHTDDNILDMMIKSLPEDFFLLL